MSQDKDAEKNKLIFDTIWLKQMGLSNKEIAEKMECSDVTVSRRLKQGRQMLMKVLSTCDPEDLKKIAETGELPKEETSELNNNGLIYQENLPQKKTGQSTGGLLVPPRDAFGALKTFQEIGSIGGASGAATGLALVDIRDAFLSSDMSDEERIDKAAKGASLLATWCLGLYQTYLRLVPDESIER